MSCRAIADGQGPRIAAGPAIGADGLAIFSVNDPANHVDWSQLKGAHEHFDVPFVFEVRDLWPQALINIGALRNPLVIWWLPDREHGYVCGAVVVVDNPNQLPVPSGTEPDTALTPEPTSDEPPVSGECESSTASTATVCPATSAAKTRNGV